MNSFQLNINSEMKWYDWIKCIIQVDSYNYFHTEFAFIKIFSVFYNIVSIMILFQLIFSTIILKKNIILVIPNERASVQNVWH